MVIFKSRIFLRFVYSPKDAFDAQNEYVVLFFMLYAPLRRSRIFYLLHEYKRAFYFKNIFSVCILVI